MNAVTTFEYSPHVLVLQQFVRNQGGDLPTAAIRQRVQALPRFPAVSLLDMREVLLTLGAPVTIAKSSVAQLPASPLPLITSLARPDGKFFVVLVRCTPDHVVYYAPDRGRVTEPLDRFLVQWQEALVLSPAGSLLAQPATDDEELTQARLYQQRDVRILDDFFSAHACEHIISLCEGKYLFNQSAVENNREHLLVASARSSYTAFLKDLADPVLDGIYRKVAGLLGVPENWIEPLQCVRYNPRQEYRPHYDSNDVNLRKHTFFVYLNDDFERGETFFPELHYQVEPRKGRAVYFLNRDQEDNLIPFSVHAGLPVETGIKYGCNVWIRSRRAR
jgi:prolyl 4-hydroxylase